MAAGVRFGLHVDDAEALADLRGLLARAHNLEPAFEAVGSMLESATQQRFEAHEDPEGRPWPALSAATKKRRGPSAEPLRDTLRLADSISYLADREEVAVGSNVIYARIHQLGGRAGRGHRVTIPARPYLGASDSDLKEASVILLEHLGSAVA